MTALSLVQKCCGPYGELITSGSEFEEFLIKISSQKPLDSLREFFLCLWRQRVWRSLREHLRLHKSMDISDDAAALERELGRNCLGRAKGADWWEWTKGSTLFFWRWPSFLQT